MRMIYELYPLLAMFVVGVGFWALGQWLRRKGRGDQLDRLGVLFVKARHYSYRLLGPLFGRAAVGLNHTLKNVPLLGSKRSGGLFDVPASAPEKQQEK